MGAPSFEAFVSLIDTIMEGSQKGRDTADWAEAELRTVLLLFLPAFARPGGRTAADWKANCSGTLKSLPVGGFGGGLMRG